LLLQLLRRRVSDAQTIERLLEDAEEAVRMQNYASALAGRVMEEKT
jgi:hypothetical protein